MTEFEDWEDMLNTFIDTQISQIDTVTDGIEEIDELPDHVWPDERSIDNYMHYIKGSIISDIKWLAVELVENEDEIDHEDIDTSEVRKLAFGLVENRRDEVEEALKKK